MTLEFLRPDQKTMNLLIEATTGIYVTFIKGDFGYGTAGLAFLSQTITGTSH